MSKRKAGGRIKKKLPESLAGKCKRLTGACAALVRERSRLLDEMFEIREALGSENALNAIALLKERHATILLHAGAERVRMSRELNLALGGVNSWPDMLQRVATLAAATGESGRR